MVTKWPETVEWQEMAENGTSEVELNSRQHRAITALLTTRNISEAATVAQVGERTLYRWLSEPAFRAALSAAEGAAIDAATRSLLALQAGAIDTIEALMNDSEQPGAVRLRAAQSVLDYLLQLRDLRNMENRLAALEAAYAERSEREKR